MKHILKPALSLFFIAAIFTALLAFVRDLTLEPIENQRRNTMERTMNAVLTEALEFKEIPAELSGSMVRVFEGKTGDEIIGFVIELAPIGYSGEINMMVGISTLTKTITGMRILRHSETPGLGALAVKENFYRKFDGRGLNPLRVVRTGAGENEIDAITSSTITTVAIVSAVNEAMEWFNGSFGNE
jgi:electron transport complex protein RnfG